MKLNVLHHGLALTAAAAIACSGKSPSEPVSEPPFGNPPPPPQDKPESATPGDLAPPLTPDPPGNPPVLLANPPPPSPREAIPVRRGLPQWEDVKSPHPPGATNPPYPVLLVGLNGRCYKTWEGGMIPPGPDRVEPTVTADARTTAIECPLPKALEVWDAWVAQQTKAP
jgi:hypothetical protein